jgi:hypothetical protein
MKLKWKVFRIVYSAIFLIYMVMVLGLNIYKHFQRSEFKASTINGIFFYGSSFISFYLFHRLNWKRFTIELCTIENIFISDKYKHPPKTWSLRKKIYLSTAVGFTFSLVNQVLYAAAETHKILYIQRECNWTRGNFLEDYVREHLRHIFNWMPYNHAFGEMRSSRVEVVRWIIDGFVDG